MGLGPQAQDQESQLCCGQLPHLLNMPWSTRCLPHAGEKEAVSPHVWANGGALTHANPSLRPAAIGGVGAWLSHLQGDTVSEDAG